MEASGRGAAHADGGAESEGQLTLSNVKQDRCNNQRSLFLLISPQLLVNKWTVIPNALLNAISSPVTCRHCLNGLDGGCPRWLFRVVVKNVKGQIANDREKLKMCAVIEYKCKL